MSLADRIIAISKRRPSDEQIPYEGDKPYLLRWWILRTRWFGNIYLHRTLRSDDDRALHTHPWLNISIVLRRGYWEHMPVRRSQPNGETYCVWRGAGSVIFRMPWSAHRLEVDPNYDGETWSLFITGPKLCAWGFWCPQGWRHHREFGKQGCA